MIIRRYFLALFIIVIIDVEHAHFCRVKCFVIICVLWYVISSKRVCPFISWFSILCEVLHGCEHYLLFVAFQWVILFVALNIKFELGSLYVVNIVLFSNAGLVILVLNMKGLCVIIVTRDISKHVIVSELFLLLIECYLFP